MSMSKKAVALRADLMAVYRELSSPERELIQLYAIVYGPIAKVKLLDCVNRYVECQAEPAEPASRLDLQQLTPLVNHLSEQQLLVAQGGYGPRCHPLLVELITRDALDQGTFEPMAAVVQAQFPLRAHGWNRSLRLFQSEDEFIREVRIGLYRRDWDFIEQQFEAYYSQPSYAASRLSMAQVFELICNNPFDSAWLLTLKSDADLFEAALGNLCVNSLMAMTPAEGAFTLLQRECAGPDATASDHLRGIWIEQLIARGHLDDATAALESFAVDDPIEQLLYRSWLSCLGGDYAHTLDLGAAALKLLKKATGKRKIYFDTLPGIFLVLALLKDGTPASLKEAEGYAHIIAEQTYRHWMSVIYSCLEKVAQTIQGDTAAKRYLTKTPVSSLDNAHSFEALIDMLCLSWVDIAAAEERLPDLAKQLYKAATAAGYHWFALEAAELLSRLNPDSAYGQKAPSLRQSTGIVPLAGLITPKQPWELSLTALMGLNPDPAAQVSTSEYRLAWFLTIYSSETWLLQPKEQKLSAKGGWSKGRAIALRRLKHEAKSFNYLTPQDLEICSHLVADAYSYGYDNYAFLDRALPALAGHPLVFWEDAPTTRIDVVVGEPALLVHQARPGQLEISLTPEPTGKDAIALVKETPTRLRVVEFTASHRRIAEVLGPKNALEVPDSAKDQVLAAINAVAGLVTVHSDIGGGVANAEAVEAQPQPHLHLLPAGDGLRVSLLTRPFGDNGPYYSPGTGGEMVIAEIGGKRLQTHRDLPQEQQLADAVEAACPTLQRLEDEGGEWHLGDPEDCLELLLEIQDLGDQAVVEWPEGETLRIANRVSLGNFKLQIQRQRDWFAASGELHINDDEVMDMQRLMELMEGSPGRFIKLADGQFLALTQEFRKRLDDLRAYSESSGSGRRFHPLAGVAMEDWLDDVGQLTTDQHWKTHLQRIKDAKDLKPELPSTLQAELRDYQIEGFNWLARLAHWGVGACLADDMGLGKTLQALAIIVARATAGPTLIVAPTSVGMNWLSEAERFAPTLNPMQFGSGNRQKVLEKLQPFDLVVCSYGLLQQDDVSEMLAKVAWQTIVLDEAQAIKNSATKRSKAAMKLQGRFKILTTGTPIENHLGELWNLFRFINPGLLGSQDQFSQRFANAIERNQDKPPASA
jgi:hypothetical protein